MRAAIEPWRVGADQVFTITQTPMRSSGRMAMYVDIPSAPPLCQSMRWPR